MDALEKQIEKKPSGRYLSYYVEIDLSLQSGFTENKKSCKIEILRLPNWAFFRKFIHKPKVFTTSLYWWWPF